MLLHNVELVYLAFGNRSNLRGRSPKMHLKITQWKKKEKKKKKENTFHPQKERKGDV